MVAISKKAKFNNDKFKEAILFLLTLAPNGTIEGKKKLAKLLYFADFNYFEAYEKPLTGASYRALPMGPVPDELDRTIKVMKDSDIKVTNKKTSLKNDTIVFSLTSKDNLFFNNLSDKEKQVLKKVFSDYGKLSGGDLERITHSEPPYNAVAQGESIPYELSFYRDKTMYELVGV